MDASGVCQPIGDQCATWNEANGECLTCYGGYILNNGQCIVNPNPFSGESNALCGEWKGEQCLSCAPRAYFNSFGICTPVSDQCQTWDPIDGSCLTCYGGYSLISGACEQSPIAPVSDVGCKTWNAAQDLCLACSHRFFFDGQSKKCTPVSDQCSEWDASGACTKCYDGYDLALGACVVSTRNSEPSDVGCGTWDWKNQRCLECSNNFVFNNFGVCVPVSDQCKTFDRSGACVSCYEGYNLNNGACHLAPIEKVSDVGCGTWDWAKRKCIACSNNFVFNNFGVCVPVSDQCNTFDGTGACVTCYEGYNLINGACVLAPLEKVSDLGCGTWNWAKRECIACSDNFVFNNQGVCTPVSDQCKTFDLSGACVSCYDGYNLNNGACVLAPIEKVSDEGCALWDWANRKCLTCSDNFVSINGKCTPVSDQCKTFDLSGACVSCYEGYNLNNGACELAPIEKVSDVGCGLWDWANRKCLRCSDNWVFNNNGICVPVSDQCKTFDGTGACVSCYEGYNLVQGACELAPIQEVSDVGCGLWDWKNQRCLRCSENFVSINGKCTPVSDQCKTFNPSGACMSCYKGYNLIQGRCELAPLEKVSDLGCGKWNWDKKVCLECSHRFVFNGQGVCVPVSDNCRNWDSAGSCTDCYAGYVLNGGVCTQGNSLCETSDANGACTSCYNGYLLKNGNCIPISKLASLALYYAECCPERLAELAGNLGGPAGGHVKFHA